MTEREKMLAGLPYDPGDPDLREGRARAVALTIAINAEPDRDRRRDLVNALVKASDARAVIMPGFFCDYGVNIHWAPTPSSTPTAFFWTARKSASATTFRRDRACNC